MKSIFKIYLEHISHCFLCHHLRPSHQSCFLTDLASTYTLPSNSIYYIEESECCLKSTIRSCHKSAQYPPVDSPLTQNKKDVLHYELQTLRDLVMPTLEPGLLHFPSFIVLKQWQPHEEQTLSGFLTLRFPLLRILFLQKCARSFLYFLSVYAQISPYQKCLLCPFYLKLHTPDALTRSSCFILFYNSCKSLIRTIYLSIYFLSAQTH